MHKNDYVNFRKKCVEKNCQEGIKLIDTILLEEELHQIKMKSLKDKLLDLLLKKVYV